MRPHDSADEACVCRLVPTRGRGADVRSGIIPGPSSLIPGKRKQRHGIGIDITMAMANIMIPPPRSAHPAQLSLRSSFRESSLASFLQYGLGSRQYVLLFGRYMHRTGLFIDHFIGKTPSQVSLRSPSDLPNEVRVDNLPHSVVEALGVLGRWNAREPVTVLAVHHLRPPLELRAARGTNAASRCVASRCVVSG